MKAARQKKQCNCTPDIKTSDLSTNNSFHPDSDFIAVKRTMIIIEMGYKISLKITVIYLIFTKVANNLLTQKLNITTMKLRL